VRKGKKGGKQGKGKEVERKVAREWRGSIAAGMITWQPCP